MHRRTKVKDFNPLSILLDYETQQKQLLQQVQHNNSHLQVVFKFNLLLNHIPKNLTRAGNLC